MMDGWELRVLHALAAIGLFVISLLIVYGFDELARWLRAKREGRR